MTECKAKKVHVPTQELLHRKKCLLPDDGTIAATRSGYGTPQGEPLATYGNNNPSPRQTTNANNTPSKQATYGNIPSVRQSRSG